MSKEMGAGGRFDIFLDSVKDMPWGEGKTSQSRHYGGAKALFSYVNIQG